MKRGLLITSVVTGVLAAVFGFMAVERAMAASETTAALECEFKTESQFLKCENCFSFGVEKW